MQEFLHSFANLSLADPAVWAAVGSFLIVVLIFAFWSRKPSRHHTTTSGSNGESSFLPPTNWNSAVRRSEDKRRSVRRGGVPTPISVIDPGNPRRPMDAYVLDRSIGGIRIAMQKPLPVGISVNVRPHNSTDDVQWIPVLIRNCREIGDYYEVGCQFERELPWNLLLLFG